MTDVFVSKLDSFVREVSDMAESMFAPEGKITLAHIYAEQSNGDLAVYMCPMGPDDEAMFRVGVPLTLRAERARRWCFFAEAWMAESAASKAMEPIKHPERIEIIVFQAEDLRGNTLVASRQIYREPDKPPRLMPLVFRDNRNTFNYPMAQTTER